MPPGIEKVEIFLQYGAVGILLLVLFGVAVGLKWLFGMMRDGLNRLIDGLLKKIDGIEQKIDGLDGTIDVEMDRLHEHIRDSESRITGHVTGRVATPPPFKAYRERDPRT